MVSIGQEQNNNVTNDSVEIPCIPYPLPLLFIKNGLNIHSQGNFSDDHEEECSNNHNDNPDIIQHVKTATVKFLFPDEQLIKLPLVKDTKAAREAVEEKGEFLASRLGQTIQLDPQIDLSHPLLNDPSFIQTIYNNTLKLLNWIIEKLESKILSSSIKRQGCSILFELYEILFTLGTRLDLLHLNWDADCFSKDMTVGSEAAEGGEDVFDKNGWEPMTPTSESKIFTHTLLKCCKLMITHGSNREAYVAFIGVLGHENIGLIGKLLCLPLFAEVLKSFSTRRAAFLMSANTMLNSAFLKHENNDIILKANHDFENLHTIKNLKQWSKHYNNNNQLPYYLVWLIGTSLYMCRYFYILGDVIYTQQTDDYHAVGPNSCASLLAKITTTLILTFDPQEGKTYPVWSPILQLDSLGKENRDIYNVIHYWITFLKPYASKCVITFLHLFARAHAETFLSQLEAVNLVTPKDDGSGDLETTPLELASIAAFLCLYPDNAIPVLIPRILSYQRYTSLGLSSAYVMLHCASYIDDKNLHQEQSILKHEIDNELQQNTMYYSPSRLFENSVIDQFKKERASQFGLSLFTWVCSKPYCLAAVPHEAFYTLFTFALQPSQLLLSLLSTMSQRPNELNIPFKKDLFERQIKFWLHRYSLDLRLNIIFMTVENVLDNFVMYTDSVLNACIILFKDEVQSAIHDSGESLDITNVDAIQKTLLKLCKHMLSNSDRMLTYLSSLISLLNLLKSIFLSSKAKALQAALRQDIYNLGTSSKNVSTSGKLTTVLATLALRIDTECNLMEKGKTTSHFQANDISILQFILSDLRNLV